MMCCLKALIEEMQELAERGGDRLTVDLLMELVENGKRAELEDQYGVSMSDPQWSRVSQFELMLDLKHFETALENIKPSLTRKEIQQYRSIHRTQNV